MAHIALHRTQDTGHRTLNKDKGQRTKDKGHRDKDRERGRDKSESRRLGGLYRLFQATILVYIASSIIIQQRYLKTENVINGAVRVTLKAPLDGVNNSDYCKSAAQPCLFWNENDILYEPGVDGALITTRAQIKQYGPFSNSTTAGSQCDVNIPTIAGCDPYGAPSTLLLPTSLVADIERFTLMLEHSIRGEATGIQIRSGNMDYGVLRDTAGQVIKTFNEESRYVPATPTTVALSNDSITTLGPGNTTVHIANNATASAPTGAVHLAGDVMTVGEFLKAAGVNLDSLSGSPTAVANETVRSSGVVVIVVIQYAAKGWNPNRISYEYLPKAIPDQEYKVIETIRDFRGGNRVEINRHGIRIVFSQAGQLGQFSFMTLLTNLVAAVALFKVANIVVELMMLRLHPHKKIYDRAKFESTKDGKGKRRKEEPSNEKAVTDLQIGDRFEQEDDTVHNHSGSGSSNGIEPSKSAKEDHVVMRSAHGNMEQSGYCAESSEGESEDEENIDSEYSDSEEGEQDERKRQPTTQPPSNRLTLRPSSSQDQATTMEHGHASSIYNSSKELHRRSKTPVSNNGTFGRSSSSSLGKSVDYMGTVDWSRNGSSSGLMNNDSRPGIIAKSASYSRRPQSAAEEPEIETRFGPIRPNEFKGFNPGGLAIGGSAPTPSPPQTKIAYNYARGGATPEMRSSTLLSTPTNKIGPAVILQSPPSMQAVSPNPVFFGPETGQSRASASGPSSSKNESRRRSRQHNTDSKDQKSSSIERHMETSGRLSSRHSSSSLSSLSSSSSLSSCEGSCANENRTLNTSMSFGLGSGLNSSSTWSFGVPESPIRGYCSSSESSSGLTPKSEKTKVLHSSVSNPNLSATSSGSGHSGSTSRHGYKKHKTDKHRPALTEHSNSASTSLFNLGSPSNHSKLSLSLTSESWFSEGNAKGKRPVSIGFPGHGASSSSKKPVFGPNAFTSSSASPSPLRRSSLATDTTTTVFNMTSFRLPMPAFSSQETDTFRQKQERSSSALNTSSTSSTSTSSRGKDLQRTVRDRTLRTSSSSPSLLNGSSSGSGITSWKGSSFTTASPSSSGLIQSGSESMQHHSKELRVAIPPSLSSASAQVVPQPAHSSTGVATTTASNSTTVRPTHPQIPLQSIAAHDSALPFRSGTVTFGPASSSSEFPPDSGFQVSTPSTPAFMLATPSDGPSSASISSTRPYSAYLDYSTSGVTTPSFGTPSTTRPLPSIPASSNVSTPSSSYPTTRTFGSSSTPNLLIHNTTSTLDSSSTMRSGPYLAGSNNYSSPSLGLMSSSSSDLLSGVSGSGTSSASTNNHYYSHPTSTFFTSPITSSCTTTLAGTGIRVLGRTITMITADNKRLLLRRSEPLILNEGVGEEKAARM
ncbi:cytochrome c oxidase subunit 1 [Podila verticillata]|nr:cytochrome c oxidase subunit 1 [Podila verticillata]